MIDHIGVVVSDFELSQGFYLAALAPLGYQLLMALSAAETGHTDIAGFGEAPKPDFWISRGISNFPAVHVAFRANSRAAVDAFYRAALAAGGTDNGAPACVRITTPTTTAPSCSTRTATTSRRYAITGHDQRHCNDAARHPRRRLGRVG